MAWRCPSSAAALAPAVPVKPSLKLTGGRSPGASGTWSSNWKTCGAFAGSSGSGASPRPSRRVRSSATPMRGRRRSLTRAKVLESPRMFATLDPTIRGVDLPSKRKVLMSDTVGFIRSLPHTLVSAFRATLEEVQRASLILHVSDASSRLSAEQDAQVEIVLKELEAEKKPRLRVMNKVDLLDVEVAESLRDDAKTVYVSAVEGRGLDRLLARIDEMIDEDRFSRIHLRIPQVEGKTLAMLEAKARIYSRTYKDGAVELEVEAPESVMRRVREWVVKARD